MPDWGCYQHAAAMATVLLVAGSKTACYIAHSLLLGTEHGCGLPSPAGAIVVLRHARLLQPLPGRARCFSAGWAVADDVGPRHQGLVVRGVDAGLDPALLVVQPEAESLVGHALADESHDDLLLDR